MEEYPLVLALHEADLESSKLIECNDGNKDLADDILPIKVERTSYNNCDDEPNPFEQQCLLPSYKSNKGRVL